MTTEKAIQLLHRLSDEQFDGIHGDERREALEMAVMALKQNLVKESGDLVQDLVKDCISRQQAIDALDKHIDTFDAIDTNYLCGLRTAMSILKEMPSAQPETHDKRTETHECDLIGRQEAIDIVRNRVKRFTTACVLAVTEIEKLPSARPERKKGHWIRHITTGLGPKLNDTIECSECRIAFSTENMFRRSFCPNCGADMRGESDE